MDDTANTYMLYNKFLYIRIEGGIIRSYFHNVSLTITNKSIATVVKCSNIKIVFKVIFGIYWIYKGLLKFLTKLKIFKGICVDI